MKIFSRKNDEATSWSAAIRDFKKLKEGDPLPREGACGFFYGHFIYAGETLPVRYNGKYILFHIENDDVIQELAAGAPSWHIGLDEDMALVTILFKTGTIINHIQLPLDHARQESSELLKFLKNSDKIEINLLNLVYGKIIKEKSLAIPIPGAIKEEIKKAAG
ncbi:MAG: hypothetical protein JXA07_01325 [Spirochaetes bacterium]|nr:hypothetical protein [Spirochaetota bacterium]